MGKRRMFSKDIVESDIFLDLPATAQNLYFHLGMNADDRGYVNNPKSIIKVCSSTVGDLEALANKKFVLLRSEGLVLIKSWRINNYIQPDHLNETKYIIDLSKLYYDENYSYTERETNMPCSQYVASVAPTWSQNGAKVDTQVNLSKFNLSKFNVKEKEEEKEKSSSSVFDLEEEINL